jgi:hypothetical protein
MDSHGDDSSHCAWSNQTATPTSYSADMSCASGNTSGKMTGHAVMTIDSPESFRYTMKVDVTKGSERVSTFEINAKAKFIGANCFGLKPGDEIDVDE